MWGNMGLKNEDNILSLAQKIEEKHAEITGYRRKLVWKFFHGDEPNAYKASFDDSSWETLRLPAKIDIRKKEAWLRARVVVPENIAGLEVSGSTVKLSSSPILDKTEIFVDSKKVFSASYWADLRDHKILLAENVASGTSFVIAIHLHRKYEPVNVPQINLTYSRIEKAAFELESFAQELRFARVLDAELAEAVSKEFDVSVLDQDISAVIEEIEKARRKMSGLAEKAKEFKVHLVAHAHIDMNWLWPWEDTVATIKDTFSTMIKLMDKYPDFHFSQSQAVTYQVVEEKFPRLFEAIKQYVKKGNWDITASMWTESDLNMAGTEALVRQFLQAKRYIKDKFGLEPKVCWEPDTFGHIWSLPQVIKKAGGNYYYFMRCPKSHTIFWWQAPDGSKVLAFTSIYNNTVNPKSIMDVVINLYSKYRLKNSMFVYGVGNHGGGATIEDIESAHELQKKQVFPKIMFSSTHSFFKEVEKELENNNIPVISDELQYVFDGCYTTHADVKRHNRLCERLLVDAEKFQVFSRLNSREILQKAWQNTLFNQFHDILDGSGTPEAYERPRKLAEETLKIAEETLCMSLKRLAEKVKMSHEGIPIVVFNPLSWKRTDLVKVKLPKDLVPENAVAVSASDGKKTPVQMCGDELLFIAEVPPLGYRTYYVVEAEKPEKLSKLATGENVLENEYFKLEIDEDSGTISSLYDKTTRRFVFKKNRYSYTKPVYSNLLQVLYELPHGMSAWIIGDISRIENLIRDADVELIETGPVRATIKVIHKLRKSLISQYISVYRNIPRIDFHMVIDWKETSNDKTEAPMLKVSFTPILGNSKATFEVPFGYIERVADGTEVPALRWVDISDKEYGLSLLNDSKYGFDVNGNTVRMTLVRTSYSPDPKPDQGIHKFNYAIYPHKGSWKEALTFRKGYEINHPFEAVALTERSSLNASEPEEKSYVQASPENVVVSCLKLAEDSDDYIIRIYDATGTGADAELSFIFNVDEAFETDLLERNIRTIPVKENRVKVQLQPFEIKTLRLKRG